MTLRNVARTLTALAVSATLALGVLPAGAASAADAAGTGPAVGAQFHGLWTDWSDRDITTTLDALAAAGTTWIRVDVGWASLEERGSGQVSEWYARRVDLILGHAAARKLQVLATLWATPAWANGGRGTATPPDSAAEYARVAGWAAKRWRGQVAAWEIWNEPNLPSFFTADAASYVKLLRAAYPAVKAADPAATVVFGAPAYNDTPWLAQAYAAGAAGAFDAMATHPYQSPSDLPPEQPDDGGIWTMSHVAVVRALMDANGDAAKPIWFTEFGWSAHANTPATKAWERGVSAATQADYLVRSLEVIRRDYPSVTHVFWYMARDRATGNAQQDGYGLLTVDLKPKPVYTRLASYLAQRASAGGAEPVSGGKGMVRRPRAKSKSAIDPSRIISGLLAGR